MVCGGDTVQINVYLQCIKIDKQYKQFIDNINCNNIIFYYFNLFCDKIIMIL